MQILPVAGVSKQASDCPSFTSYLTTSVPFLWSYQSACDKQAHLSQCLLLQLLISPSKHLRNCCSHHSCRGFNKFEIGSSFQKSNQLYNMFWLNFSYINQFSNNNKKLTFLSEFSVGCLSLLETSQFT